MPSNKQPRIILAPFRGITGKAYRNAFARNFGGFDEMYSPFISGVGNQRINPSKLTDLIPKADNITPLVPQFISIDPNEIILLGKTLQDHGYDHINWNLGCPFSRIANKKRGCGLLPYPDELDAILNRVFSDFPIKLSVKTRLGYFHKEEILKVIEVFNRYPIHLLILHPRLGTQIYGGEADPEGFAKTLAISDITMAYNGDIFHLKRFAELKALFPTVNQWMLGRGALINPFLPQQIKGDFPDEEIKRNQLRNFNLELLNQGLQTSKNEGRILGSLKAVWYYMSGVFQNSSEVFAPIKQSNTLDNYMKSVSLALQAPFANYCELENYFKKGIKHIGKIQ